MMSPAPPEARPVERREDEDSDAGPRDEDPKEQASYVHRPERHLGATKQHTDGAEKWQSNSARCGAQRGGAFMTPRLTCPALRCQHQQRLMPRCRGSPDSAGGWPHFLLQPVPLLAGRQASRSPPGALHDLFITEVGERRSNTCQVGDGDRRRRAHSPRTRRRLRATERLVWRVAD